jgi:hypothetical protein
MSFAKTIAVLILSLMCLHCSSDANSGPNFPGSTENDFSLLFDGVDGYGSAGTISATLGETIDEFSISLWFKAVGAPAADSMMLHLNPQLESGDDSMQVRVYWDTSSRVAFHITPDFAGELGATLFADVADPQEWNSIMLTFDAQAPSENAKMYLNGEEVDSGNQGASLDAVGNIQFGTSGAGVDYFSGYLDEVAIWDTPLAGDEIDAVYNDGKPKNVRFDIPGYESAASVRSLWRMGDENFSEEGNVSDLVGQNHFTIVGRGSFERETP